MRLWNMDCMIVSPIAHVNEILRDYKIDYMISILAPQDRCDWPIAPRSKVLRLDFDDVGYSSELGRAANVAEISSLMNLASEWNGKGNLLIHCRAGTSRSPAAGLIALSCISGIDFDDAALAFLNGKSYFRPNSHMLRVADQITNTQVYSTIIKSYRSPSREDVLGPSIFSVKPFVT